METTSVTISLACLWAVTLALGLAVLSQARLLGLMHQRIGPAPARPLPDRFPIGSQITQLKGATVDDQTWSLEFPSSKDVLLTFISPQCPACNRIMPHLKDYKRSFGEQVDVVLFSVIDDLMLNRAYLHFADAGDLLYLRGESVAESFGTPATPYAVRLDRSGTVVGKGVVNGFEHLASLNGRVPVSKQEARG